MLSFNYPTLEDRIWLQPILSQSGWMGSEAAFGTLFLWNHTYHSKICRHENFVFLCSGKHCCAYNFPIGENPYEGMELLIEDAKEKKIPFKMWGITQPGIEELQRDFPGRFEYDFDRNGSDYIYSTKDLITLSGRKYHSKRNHIAKFERSYAWRYEEITQDNMNDCREIAIKWKQDNDGPEAEMEALEKAFQNFEALHLQGGLIYVNEKPAAFTIGEEINAKVFLLHFEKALPYDGLYAVINHEFAQRHLEQYDYVNREEDMGLEGLRKAKLSYQPAFLLQKYAVSLKEPAK
ncbi:DUF2156 domain-containing protein [Caproicibacterium sp. BJN0003]|uniref:DUF2156 domain-containing protein n=1 Tax=Caproicibacterium sp. BJN0003 TaxID=2994078 RepID=UPI0022508C83|nr:phosphatidylglycerol lysyltransferase domain-containing protein [Caproicibacterium sp. BJN0003]UZT83247.1 phosphatidylglycerol lysyltransferase domain-containing protein [Caproicibacterium sp. BJN0003]